MTRLPRVTGREVIAALRKAGFQVARIKGSHHFLRHPDGRGTVEPVTPVRRSARDCSRQFFAIARSNEMNSPRCCSRRCFQAPNITFGTHRRKGSTLVVSGWRGRLRGQGLAKHVRHVLRALTRSKCSRPIGHCHLLALALLLSFVAAPLAVDAQQSQKVYRIGMLERTSRRSTPPTLWLSPGDAGAGVR